MPSPSTGNAFCSRGKWYARTPIAPGKRHCSAMPWCHVDDDAGARGRAALLAELARDLRKVPDSRELMTKLLDRAGAAATTAELRAVRELVSRIGAGRYAPALSVAVGGTFGEIADAWTSGGLAKRYPDHVKAKKTAVDDRILVNRYMVIVRDVPIARFTLDHAQRVMSGLPEHLSPGSRRHVAQVLARVLGLAVFPLRLIPASPIPRGWLPRVPRASQKQQAIAYPAEHDAFVASAAPIAVRLFAGFVAREGMRHDEAGRLTWADVDLERGLVRLDENKTDDPRAWALRPSVARALAKWRELRGRPEASEPIFVDESGRKLSIRASGYRELLLAAGIKRDELHKGSATTKPTGFHALRSLFVTERLAVGASERWISDRTGHKSSEMIGRYQRRARSWAEAHVPELGDLDVLLGWATERATAAPERDPRVVKRRLMGRRTRKTRRFALLRTLLAASKSGEVKASAGSNPALSARCSPRASRAR